MQRVVIHGKQTKQRSITFGNGFAQRVGDCYSLGKFFKPATKHRFHGNRPCVHITLIDAYSVPERIDENSEIKRL